MNNEAKATDNNKQSGFVGFSNKLTALVFSARTYKLILRVIFVIGATAVPYWLFVASDRYVSEAKVIIQKTDAPSAPTAADFAAIASGAGGLSRSDQLLLREYLLSVDMLKKLDAAFNLRNHYSDGRLDFVSRMWFKDAPIEWFYRYWLTRIDVVYDDYSGVLYIRAQAYDASTARSLAEFLVREGEAHMNKLGHELAQAQITFLTTQVSLAQERLHQATGQLLAFQNRKGLVSPKIAIENSSALIAALEAKKVEVETQLATLPANLSANNPALVMLQKNRQALLQHISEKRAELAAPTGKTLSFTIEEFQRLQIEVDFVQDVYKTALAALERGRMDAARTLKKVSILQAPTEPVYPIEPRRLYNVGLTVLLTGALIGVLKLLEGIVLDHVD
ncbi:MAG: hypothetical protein JNM98_16575 [Rhodocyclaceae bacterium]|nr:hypothetical protein [Rhodocyclaceae bacterium]